MIKDMATFVEPYLPPGFRTRLQQKPNGDTGSSTTGPSSAPLSLPTAPAAPADNTAPTDNKQSQ